MKLVYTFCFYIYVSLNKRIKKMSIANLQGIILFCEAEKADKTSRLCSIMSDITKATGQMTELTQQGLSAKMEVNAKAEESSAYADSTQYQSDLADAEGQFEVKMAEINAWEAELEQEKEQVQTQLQEVTAYEESFTAALKSNIKKDFSYGGSTGQ